MAQRLSGQVDGQRVGSHGGDEHARGDGGAEEAGHHQEGAHLLLGAVGRVGAYESDSHGRRVVKAGNRCMLVEEVGAAHPTVITHQHLQHNRMPEPQRMAQSASTY